jgi:hypothetical protein
MKYDMGDIRSVLRDPRLIKNELLIYLRNINQEYHKKKNGEKYNKNGTDIFDEQWDNLIILDACRYDIFEQVHELPGQVEKRISRGSTSNEFVVGNFSDKKLHDTVYISGNSWFGRLKDEINAEVYKYSFVDGSYSFTEDGIPEKTAKITQRAKNAIQKYPNKRIIIHYMLPHKQYIGPTAREHFADLNENQIELYKLFRSGSRKESDELLKQSYRENLNIILDVVNDLLNFLPGISVVTADHGEMLGERAFPIPYKEYGHFGHMHVDELVEVPWLVHKNGKKSVISEPSVEDDVNQIEVDEHLRDLGYIQ